MRVNPDLLQSAFFLDLAITAKELRPKWLAHPQEKRDEVIRKECAINNDLRPVMENDRAARAVLHAIRQYLSHGGDALTASDLAFFTMAWEEYSRLAQETIAAEDALARASAAA